MGQTEIFQPDDAGIDRAARLLRKGGLVAFPTETVYGLGALATDPDAVAGIYRAKGRPSFNPLIVHVPGTQMARQLGQWSPLAQDLADAFWPGALTLVLPLAEGAQLAPGVTAGLASVGLRCPAHPVAQALLRATAGPVAAPSANPSGMLSPTSAAHVRAGLDRRIDGLLDGGPCPVGVESTILDLTGPPRVLRAGSVTRADLAPFTGPLTGALPTDDQAPASPGQLTSHYAPKARLRLDADTVQRGETWLGFGNGPQTWSLSPEGDLAEAAARLFHTLHAMDAAGIARIAVAQIPDHGIGQAINDRLRRAAAPKASDL